MLKASCSFVALLVLFAAPVMSQAADHYCPNCGRVVSSNTGVTHAQPIQNYATPASYEVEATPIVQQVSYAQPVYEQPVTYAQGVSYSSPVTHSTPTQNYSYGNSNNSAYAHAVRSANYRASRGIKGHAMTAGFTEGVGFSTRSAQDAIRQCCYSGSSMNRRVSVVRGRDGWYATSVYTR